jgi:hypothetical protein
MPFTVPMTRSTGNILTATNWNAELVDNMKWLGGDRPSCKGYRTTPQSVGSGVQSVIGFDLEEWDTASIHSPAVNNSRFTCPVTGRYRFTTMLQLPAGGSYYFFIEPRRGGVGTADRVGYTTNGFAAQWGGMCVTERTCTAGDYFEATIFHNAGSAVDVTGWAQLDWVSR